MKTPLLFSVMIMALVFSSLLFAGSTAAPLSSDEIRQAIAKKNGNTILFFQNPLGAPCREQKSILESLHAELKKSFNIANISTMKQEDQKAFYDYGVRSLPLLVMVDRNGNIVKMFPPGIQSAATLKAALESIK